MSYRCPACGENLQSRGSELFRKNGLDETYKFYKCSRNHRVEIFEKAERLQKDESIYNRYNIEYEKARMQCPICYRMTYHISDDVTTDLDVIFHHKRYVCRENPKHVFRILLDCMHNNDPRWEEFDRQVFGFSMAGDKPD